MNRKTWILILALAIGLCLFAMPLMAADEGHGAGAGHAEEKALLHWDLGSALWSIIVFVVLLIILRVAAWKPILRALQDREKFIRDTIADAKHERSEAERMLKDYTEKVNKACDEATAIIDEGRRDAEEVRKRIHAEAKTEADAIIERARKDIELARDDAVKQLYAESVKLATIAAGKIVRRELKEQDQQALLDESLSELQKLDA